jgi:beta-mannanase
MKKSIIILLLIMTIISLLYLFFQYLNEKESLMEKNHKSCLMGITIDSPNIFEKYDYDKYFGIINIFIAWEDSFPADYAEYIKINNKILMVTWEPYLHKQKDKNILYDIIYGKYDNLINNFCTAMKKTESPIFLRWGHEMNGNWYSWAGNQNIYKEAYIHIFKIFKKNNCDNVKFIFSINNFDANKQHSKFEKFYPGNIYVDVIGIDGYNWGNTKKSIGWKSPESVFSESYSRVKKLSPEKPVFITEIGSSSNGGNKRKWIRDFCHLLSRKYKSVKAVIWFNIDKETDWSITNNMNIWESYIKEINDSYFTNDPKTINWIFK